MLCELKDFCSFSECSQLQWFQKLNLPCKEVSELFMFKGGVGQGKLRPWNIFSLYMGQFCALCITDSLWPTQAGEKEHTDVKHLAWLCVKNMTQLHWVGQKVSLKVWCSQQGPMKKSLTFFEVGMVTYSKNLRKRIGREFLYTTAPDVASWCLTVLTGFLFSPQICPVSWSCTYFSIHIL